MPSTSTVHHYWNEYLLGKEIFLFGPTVHHNWNISWPSATSVVLGMGSRRELETKHEFITLQFEEAVVLLTQTLSVTTDKNVTSILLLVCEEDEHE